jgi:hypothetical protein
MPVSGYFSYDYDLLSAPDSSGNRTVASVPSSSFVLFSGIGEGAGYFDDLLQLRVDASGLPYLGSGQGPWDAGITSSTAIETLAPGNYWQANVTYTITGVPDGSATWFLLGVGLAGVAVARYLSPSPSQLISRTKP